MNSFEEGVSQYLGWDNLRKIQSYKVGIGGAGGLGSNCAVNLVRSGFKSFVIVDFDRIEYSNLNRQFYFNKQVGMKKVRALKENLLSINPDLKVEVREIKVTSNNIKEIFKESDIVVEAFDEVASKKLMVEEFMRGDKFLVAASGIAGSIVNEIKTKKIRDRFYITGDFLTEVSKEIPPLSPKVNIIAARQADIILKAVLEGEI